MQKTLKAAVVRVRGKPLAIEDVLESLETFLRGASPQGGLERGTASRQARRSSRSSILPMST